MSNLRKCAVCSKSIDHRRPQTKTCSNSCRTSLWRLSNAGPVSIKVVLSKLQFNHLKTEADDLGVLINRLILDRTFQQLATVGV